MKKTTLVSDISGADIPERQGAKVRVTFEDSRRGVYELDMTADEAQELAAHGRKVARRGRKPREVATT